MEVIERSTQDKDEIDLNPYYGGTRYKRKNLEETYYSKRFQKINALLQKAHMVKHDFADYIDPRKSPKFNSPAKKKFGRRNPDDLIEAEEIDFIANMTKMAWNKSLRRDMPKEVRFCYKFDPPLIRCLIYYICYNTKMGVDYEALEPFDIFNEGERSGSPQKMVKEVAKEFGSDKNLLVEDSPKLLHSLLCKQMRSSVDG